jgi:hypothetical protein
MGITSFEMTIGSEIDQKENVCVLKHVNLTLSHILHF